jgi:hypothetical protein
MNKENLLPPMEIPREVLTSEALQGIIENFIQREGTDYGVEEVSMGTKIHQIEKQLDKGEIKIVFDPNTETVTLLTLAQWKSLTS